MPAVTIVTLRLPFGLVERIDEACAEGQSRNAWLVAAAESALADRGVPVWPLEQPAVERALEASGPDPAQPASLSGSQAASPAPAEQPERKHELSRRIEREKARPFRGSYDPFKKR